MLTTADDIRAQIAAIDRELADTKLHIARKRVALEQLRAHEDGLHVRRMRLEGMLERESAALVRPQPKGVKVDGWDI